MLKDKIGIGKIRRFASLISVEVLGKKKDNIST